MSTLHQELYQLHASVCKGLADPKRLLIINALRDGERSVSEICEAVDLPQANVSQHLAVLREKGLVVARKDGQWVYYSMSSPKITQALDLLREVMSEQFAATSSV
ncbi:MAG: winged helix-turn-helix transcriptional regulator [Acidimicrobiia bacterium]|nr:winged helix-turn-helix transcriptional regulator [Acidimicrobiia bacterium]